MSRQKLPELFEYFAEVDDPRVQGRCLYRLDEILFITVCGVIGGCNTALDVAVFADAYLSWFRKYIPLRYGAPSHDTIGRVLNLIKPKQFAIAFLRWSSEHFAGTNLSSIAQEQLVAIDGKRLRGSARRSSDIPALEVLGAWSVGFEASIGHLPVEKGRSEIAAIPELLGMLELEGATVSIDAAGTQTAIAEQIVAEGADYVLAVKGNQPSLHQRLIDYFEAISGKIDESDERSLLLREKQHGRIEERFYHHCPIPESLSPDFASWSQAKSIGFVSSIVERSGKQTMQVRYFISSFEADVERFARSVRGHWRIENSLHYVLDVSLAEDAATTLLRNAAANMATIRRLVVTLVKLDDSKGSINSKRKRAGWNTDFLEKLVFQ